MISNKEITQKKCCFYVSDFHLEMTIVPYINKKIQENKNIIIVTQNKLEDSIKILISKMNIKNKQKILDLNWNNEIIEQTEKIEQSVIIINGDKKFIETKNQELEQLINNQKVEVINCFKFDEIKEEIVEIRDRYAEVLNNLQKRY